MFDKDLSVRQEEYSKAFEDEKYQQSHFSNCRDNIYFSLDTFFNKSNELVGMSTLITKEYNRCDSKILGANNVVGQAYVELNQGKIVASSTLCGKNFLQKEEWFYKLDKVQEEDGSFNNHFSMSKEGKLCNKLEDNEMEVISQAKVNELDKNFSILQSLCQYYTGYNMIENITNNPQNCAEDSTEQ